MKIFDAHIHAKNTVPDPEGLIRKMDKYGIYGGCIFSNHPIGDGAPGGTSFDERLEEALAWCRGYEDRLFPILYITPYEDNITENIKKAVERGICGFKIICSNFHVYEPQSIKVLTEIAKLDKPVFFHSGILWDEGNSRSVCSKPLDFEALLNIEGLRFSLAHCGWPWIDECIALYGKFLNSGNYRNTAEMFFDTTPGTPEIYRKELLTKLYTLGYDVGDNVIYGSDSTADSYVEDFAAKWIKIDNEIMDELGVSLENREKMYNKNIMRFLGKTETKIEHFRPEANKAELWSCENKEVYKIIESFYKKLSFPQEHDREFYEALGEIKISDAISADRYNLSEKDGKRNLLSYLFMCKALKEKYDSKNIPESVFYDTVYDIVRWTNVYSDIKSELYLGELAWLSNHFKMKLFKLGRLQFCMGKCEYDIPGKGLKKGDDVLEIHIPSGGALDIDECRKSICRAKEFFAKYFPEFEYKAFICHSWLLDDTLKELLPKESNIIRFSDMFEKAHKEKSDLILKFVFKWNTARYNVKYAVCNSSFAQKVKNYAMSGKDFYIVYGVIDK